MKPSNYPIGKFFVLLAILCIKTAICSCQVLAVETFNYPANTAILGQNGGSGWADAWLTQNGNNTVPGYSTSNTSFIYPGFSFSGNCLIGGINYQSTGRQLDVSGSGPFASYLNGGIIGAGSIWNAAIIRKDGNNEDEVSYNLSNYGVDWDFTASNSIAFGYFSGNSDNGGTRYWTLRLAGTDYQLTTSPVVIGTAALIVLHIQFDYPVAGTSTVDMFVNPSLSGSPSTPDASLSTISNIGFKAMALYGSNSLNGAAFDEIRFAAGYPDAINNPATLPITLISFDAQYDASTKSVLLDWTTSQEIDAQYYFVERSTNGVNFDSIARIRAAGNASITSQYDFVDANAAVTGTTRLFYRLKETDIDGNYTYSPVRAVQIAANNLFGIFPNPATDMINIQWPYDDAAMISTIILDSRGRKIIQINNAYSPSIGIFLSQLAPGSYFVRCIDDKQRHFEACLLIKPKD
jgi:type IX secretion system substrate protein